MVIKVLKDISSLRERVRATPPDCAEGQWIENVIWKLCCHCLPCHGTPTEFLLDFLLQELHFLGLAMDQEHVPGLGLADELHDALGVGVGAEGHVLHLHLHFQLRGAEHRELRIPLEHTHRHPAPSGFR